MKPVIIGLLTGLLVFFGLLLVFAAGTGPVELALWFGVAVASGLVAGRLSKSGNVE